MFNLFIVWLLTGIWHGANWTFIIWGLLYFVIQYIEKKMLGKRNLGLAGRAYTLLCVLLCWVIFRSDSIKNAYQYIKKMFGMGVELVDETAIRALAGSWKLFLVAVVCCIPWKNVKQINWIPAVVKEIAGQIVIVSLFFISLLSIINGNFSPFIYFNF